MPYGKRYSSGNKKKNKNHNSSKKRSKRPARGKVETARARHGKKVKINC